MSQVGYSRPSTQQSFSGAPKLPEIQHPLSRLGRPDNLGVQGVSRASTANGYRPNTRHSYSGRPLAAEDDGQVVQRRSLQSSGGRSLMSRASRQGQQPVDPIPFRYESIPEGVAVVAGDTTRARLPIFGSRAGSAMPGEGTREVGSRIGEDLGRTREDGGRESRVQSRLSTASAQARLDIDELEVILREKMNNGFVEMKNRFKMNDPEGKGNVTKDALFRILVTVVNRPLAPGQFTQLMDRIGLKDRNVLNYTEFYSAFREPSSSGYPRWMDPVQRQWQERSRMTAAQVHLHLKERARQRVKDIADLIPQSNPDGSGRILKPELRNSLNQMGFFMEDAEFEKLWSKYDVDGIGTINGEKMMQKLGISIDRNQFASSSPPQTADQGSGFGRTLKRKEAERQRSLDIERWLKKKFREGFSNMKNNFEELDQEKTGMVTFDQFLAVLDRYGLHLEKQHFNEFMARCSLEPNRHGVPYRDFLHKFQDRSEEGMAHNILTNTKHRYNRAESPGGQSTLSAIEGQLMNMFQRDFLALLGTFHKIDKIGMDFISQEEFRAAIESRFNLEMTEQQFRMLIDRVPLDDDGNVKYADFMAQFDTRGRAKSLFTTDATPFRRPAVEVLPRDPSPEGEGSPGSDHPSREPEDLDRLLQNPDASILSEDRPHRSTQELFKLIKDLMKKNYQEVEEAFYDLDDKNTRRLTQETMYQLLKRFDTDPEVTRGEVRDLWKTFITNSDKTLDFLQFTRHFGYSLKSATFPNAKIRPPRKGDSDFMRRTRKLNSDSDMLQESLKSKIDYMLEDLQREFTAMDPYNTGAVSAEEFRNVLSELCVHLNNFELNMLTRKFMTSDNRVSYWDFLQPFSLGRELWRSSNMLAVMHHPNEDPTIPEVYEPPQNNFDSKTSKFRYKLAGEWKNLRRAFKKLDINNEGSVSLSDFKMVMKNENVSLDEDEIFHVMSHFDKDMTGKISYILFLNEAIAPPSRSRNALSRSSHF